MANDVKRNTEKMANEDEAHAEEIRANGKTFGGILEKTHENLFEASGVDVGSIGVDEDAGLAIHAGIYGQMLAAGDPGDGTILCTLPSARWLALQGFDINKAVGLRLPKGKASKMIAGENGQTFKAVIMADIARLRSSYLQDGTDAALLRAKLVQIISIGNEAYAEFLVK